MRGVCTFERTAASSTAPADSKRASAHAWPISCSPMGRPATHTERSGRACNPSARRFCLLACYVCAKALPIYRGPIGASMTRGFCG